MHISRKMSPHCPETLHCLESYLKTVLPVTYPLTVNQELYSVFKYYEHLVLVIEDKPQVNHAL